MSISKSYDRKMDGKEFLSAISKGDRSAVADALRADRSLANTRAQDGSSALQRAVYFGHADLVEELLGAGAEVDLASACTIGKINAISDDADVNGLSGDGFRPIALAAGFGHNDIVRLLLDRGADPNLDSPALGTVPPLQSAVFGRNMEAVRMLIEAGADVNGRQGGGFTALMGAAQNADLTMVRYLIDRGADRSLRDNDGKSAVEWAATEQIGEALKSGCPSI